MTDAAPAPAADNLTPANENPYYWMATLYGEQEGENNWNIDEELHAKNRRAWNRWMAAALDDDQRATLCEKGFPEEELTPFDAEEAKTLLADYRQRCGDPQAKPPEPGDVDFSRTHFELMFVAAGFFFAGTVDFSEASFARDAEFRPASFSKNVVFRRASFCRQAIFGKVLFAENAVFDKASFASYACFREASFASGTDFEKASFASGADFEKASFTQTAYFRVAFFNGSADFRGASFAETAYFHEASFAGSADFRKAFFAWRADFREASFARFAYFREASFADGAYFQRANFKAEARFDQAAFQTFPPEFFGAQFQHDTFFHSATWPPIPTNKDDARHHADAYERLKEFMDSLKRQEDEMFFFVKELQCKTPNMPFFQRWATRLFGFTSGYGLSIARPLAGLALITLAGFAALLFVGGPGQAVMLSLAQTFGLIMGGAFQDDLKVLPQLLRIVGGFQTLFGTIGLFLIGLALRNRFRVN